MNNDPKEKNLFPIFGDLLQKEDKEHMLSQKARVIWMTGLSGSGKTTLAKLLEKELHQRGYLTELLDGDNVRVGINNNLGFSPEDRDENIRRIAEVSKLFLNCGIVTINCFVSPSKAMRSAAKAIIGDAHFTEVYVNAPLEVCESRDVKGLYAKARAGEIKQFTGIDAPYEAPETPDLEVNTDQETQEASVEKLINHLLPLIRKES